MPLLNTIFAKHTVASKNDGSCLRVALHQLVMHPVTVSRAHSMHCSKLVIA